LKEETFLKNMKKVLYSWKNILNG